ncbi:pirin family protein [Clostridium cylindrosporum]|uniref:Pirin-like protein n=1 Tax=Clostridium cylindrosporum DSM 605 TaxID=1121307 RepID=A0A0J8G472_CLOCY|nr:pirin family protein [Clostridium cylindrosporum]KMT22491.1 pirin-like protein [Clostridium cylindrosporum DSM 605]
MIKKIDSNTMGKKNVGWLKSTFHFSFDEYSNPDHNNFGVLRVLNDDIIQPNTGFDKHPHSNMEIVTYVIDGEISHADSLGYKRTLSRGNVQYMGAGTGVNHSEYNLSNESVRLLQIWIYPDIEEREPDYGDFRFDPNDRKNKWLHIVSSKEGDAPVKINQDVNFYVLELDENLEINFNLGEGRQAYLVQIEGTSIINQIDLKPKDALEIIEDSINIKSTKPSHFIIIEMKKS